MNMQLFRKRVMLPVCVVVTAAALWIISNHILHTIYSSLDENTQPLTEPKQVGDRNDFTLFRTHSNGNRSYTYVPSRGTSVKIAVGGAITSKGYLDGLVLPENIQEMCLFRIFLPSFCRTASAGYEYHFYFGYDFDDPIGKGNAGGHVKVAFRDFIDKNCPLAVATNVVALHLVKCEYSGKPSWAQNDAMMQAYRDGMDFFYRVNDDTKLISSAWVEIFISTLYRMRPPFVGVVGPHHDQGTDLIMTHDFVQRRHIDIFGFYYPRDFPDWFSDTWINFVYSPGRCVQLSDVEVNHTEYMGQRYEVQDPNKREDVWLVSESHKKLIER